MSGEAVARREGGSRIRIQRSGAIVSKGSCRAAGGVLLSHPTGNANVRQALLALDERSVLAEFWTTFRWETNCALHALLPPRLKAEMARRSYPQISPEKVHPHPWREAARLLAERAGLRQWTRHNEGFLSVAQVCYALDRAAAARVAGGGIEAVYAYEDGALETFRAAKRGGIATLYELPIAHWSYKRELLLEEAELCPGWAETMLGAQDTAEKTDRKDAELDLADLVIVPCRYASATLPAWLQASGRVQVCPYGAPEIVKRAAGNDARGSKLRVLYVGSLTQRKGIAYLLRALPKVDALVEVTLIGHRVGHCAELESALARYRYLPSLPHAQVLDEMERHDVLVFPSLTEGFGLVIPEAMSRGMVVVTTRHTGAPELMRDGREGFFVPIRSSDAIAEKLELLAVDREMLEAMSEAALARARECGWERYRARLAEAVQTALRPAEGAGHE